MKMHVFNILWDLFQGQFCCCEILVKFIADLRLRGVGESQKCAQFIATTTRNYTD